LLDKVIHRFRYVSLYSLAIFTRQLATLIHAGIPILRAVQALAEQTVNVRLNSVAVAMANDLKEGHSLSRSMARQGDVFSPIFVSMVRAGEISGAMDEILDRLATYLEREFALRKKIESATTYPMVVFAACVGLTVFLVNFVFPAFIQLFQGINVALPWPTRALIAITQTLRNPSIMVPGVLSLIFSIVALRSYIQTPLGRRQWHWLMLELPILGPINQKVALNRLSRTLATMLDSGIPMLHALKTCSYAVDNLVIGDQLDDVAQVLRGGSSLAVPLGEHRSFPPLMVNLVRVGEESGNLSHMLRKLAEFYEAEIEYSLQAFVSLLEPLMVVLMGAVTGFVLLAVFSPIYLIVQQL
jgi:type IV pilus assembly protein PilC